MVRSSQDAYKDSPKGITERDVSRTVKLTTFQDMVNEVRKVDV